jgi:magnesium transporter
MEVSAITFILADRFLSTVRYLNPKPFDSFAIRLKRSGSPFSSSIEVMIGLLETLIDRMADILEFHSAEVERIAKLIFTGNDKHSATKIDHTKRLRTLEWRAIQFSTMRESLVSINRMANYMNLAVAHHPKNKHLREMPTYR